MKNHRILVEFVSQKQTELWWISLSESGKIMTAIWKVAKDNNYDAFIKWNPKSVIDYKPTGETIEIKTVEDIAKLTPEQFEMFIEDLRSWCILKRWVDLFKDLLV